MPAFRVLVNTPSPQGSMGITTTLQPAMTLGCGAIAGNSTGDNVGPMHLVHVKRIAAAVREAGGGTPVVTSGAIDRNQLLSAVERYVAVRGVSVAGGAGSVASSVVDRFLANRAAPRAVSAAAPASCALPAPPAAGHRHCAVCLRR